MHRSEVANLLAIAAGSSKMHQANKSIAAVNLLNAIAEVAKTPGFAEAGVWAELPEKFAAPTLVIAFTSNVAVGIVYREHDGAFHFFREDLKTSSTAEETGEKVFLPFDAVAKAFVSGEPDAWVAPTPREPVPQRSAAAKLLEAALLVAFKAEAPMPWWEAQTP